MKHCCCFAKAEFPERGSLPTLCLIKTDLLSFVVVCCCELNVNKDSIKNATSKLDLIDLHRRTLQRCTVNPLRSVHPRISQEGANEGFSFFSPPSSPSPLRCTKRKLFSQFIRQHYQREKSLFCSLYFSLPNLHLRASIQP